jgi:hypothetical protein
MIVLEIALGIILAWAAIAAAPIVVGLTLGAMAHGVVALTKPRSLPPFWRNPAAKRRGPNPRWLTAIIVAALPAAAFILACLATWIGYATV